MSRALLFAAVGQFKNAPAFNPADYLYAGAINIGHVAAGGEEYGFMEGQAGSINPAVFGGRAINRFSWRRKEYYALNLRLLTVAIAGTARPAINKVAMVKDGIVILETAVISQEGTYGDGRYTIAFLTGEAAMPISGSVDIYMG